MTKIQQINDNIHQYYKQIEEQKIAQASSRAQEDAPLPVSATSSKQEAGYQSPWDRFKFNIGADVDDGSNGDEKAQDKVKGSSQAVAPSVGVKGMREPVLDSRPLGEKTPSRFGPHVGLPELKGFFGVLIVEPLQTQLLTQATLALLQDTKRLVESTIHTDKATLEVVKNKLYTLHQALTSETPVFIFVKITLLALLTQFQTDCGLEKIPNLAEEPAATKQPVASLASSAPPKFEIKKQEDEHAIEDLQNAQRKVIGLQQDAKGYLRLLEGQPDSDAHRSNFYGVLNELKNIAKDNLFSVLEIQNIEGIILECNAAFADRTRSLQGGFSYSFVVCVNPAQLDSFFAAIVKIVSDGLKQKLAAAQRETVTPSPACNISPSLSTAPTAPANSSSVTLSTGTGSNQSVSSAEHKADTTSAAVEEKLAHATSSSSVAAAPVIKSVEGLQSYSLGQLQYYLGRIVRLIQAPVAPLMTRAGFWSRASLPTAADNLNTAANQAVVSAPAAPQVSAVPTQSHS